MKLVLVTLFALGCPSELWIPLGYTFSLWTASLWERQQGPVFILPANFPRVSATVLTKECTMFWYISTKFQIWKYGAKGTAPLPTCRLSCTIWMERRSKTKPEMSWLLRTNMTGTRGCKNYYFPWYVIAVTHLWSTLPFPLVVCLLGRYEWPIDWVETKQTVWQVRSCGRKGSFQRYNHHTCTVIFIWRASIHRTFLIPNRNLWFYDKWWSYRAFIMLWCLFSER